MRDLLIYSKMFVMYIFTLTLPHWQDVTQGQFLRGAYLVLNSIFSFSQIAKSSFLQ